MIFDDVWVVELLAEINLLLQNLKYPRRSRLRDPEDLHRILYSIFDRYLDLGCLAICNRSSKSVPALYLIFHPVNRGRCFHHD